MNHVAIIDYGCGNLFSVARALTSVGLQASIVTDREAIASADAILLPGVGAFGDSMDRLRVLDLVSPIRDAVGSGKPFLGVCLGFQLLFESSDEFGVHEGLGLLPGHITKLAPEDDNGLPLKIPKVGWNQISYRRPGALFQGVPEHAFMYFVHSFKAVPSDLAHSVATASYGSEEFCVAVELRNTFGVQFHPETSGTLGRRIYTNFSHKIDETRND